MRRQQNPPSAVLATALAAGGAALTGCLPGDTRPEPGSVYVTTAPSPAAIDGVVTSDGWTIAFERLLAGVGSVELGGDGCNAYSQPRYTRVFDFALPMSEPQKLSLTYGLGGCDVGYELTPPGPDALLGPGVTSRDRDFLRVEADNAWVSEPQRTSVFVAGTATRGAATKRFEWMFRGEYDIEKCAAGPEGQPGTFIHIAGGARLSFTIVVDPAELFRETADVDAPLRFDAFAEADVDGSGDITLDELEEVDAPLVVDAGATAQEELVARSLGDVLYDTLVPRMARPPGSGACEVDLDDR